MCGCTALATDIDEGLILHWPFDGPNASARLLDSSGNNLPASIAAYSTNLSWAPGLVGTHALQLAPTWIRALGEDKQGTECPYIASPVLKSSGIRGRAPFTLSLWLKPELLVSSAGAAEWVAGFSPLKSRSMVSDALGMSIRPTESFRVGGYAAVYVYPTFRSVAGGWMHVTTAFGGIVGGSKLTVYINGELADTMLVRLNSGETSKLFIGLGMDSDLCYKGLVDDVRLYSRELSSKEVYTLWRGACNSTGYYMPKGARMEKCDDFRCPAGTVDDDSDSSTPCVACSAGQYSPAGSSGACTPCQEGSTDHDSDPSTPCVACGPGHFFAAPTGNSGPCSAHACGAGWTDDDSNATTPCVQCGAGAYAPAGSWGTCATLGCAAGTVDADSDAGTACAEVCSLAGTAELCNATATAQGCVWCHAVCAPQQAPRCNPACLTGSTAAPGLDPAAPCAPCGPGSFAPAASMSPCSDLACPAGSADADSLSSTPCVPCAPGHFAPSNWSGPCPPCPAGWTDDDADPSTECVPCGPGAYVPGGSHGPCSAFACPRGLADGDSDASTACVSACTLITVPVVCFDSMFGCDWWPSMGMFDVCYKGLVDDVRLYNRFTKSDDCNASLFGCDWCGKYCAVRAQCTCTQVLDQETCFKSYNCTWKRQKLTYHDQVDASEILMGDVIGQGSFGVVYKATWRNTEVAAKVFSMDTVAAEDIVQFEKEVDVMRALRHPNILLFMCHSKNDENFIIVTEYMPNGNLMELLANESLSVPLRLKLSIMSDIARGMAYLHQNDPPILHRDLKSSNILCLLQFKKLF
eukprot:m51a1_g10035 putative pas domain-containing protein tyrosine kinase (806) ;mRNA; f:401-10402